MPKTSESEFREKLDKTGREIQEWLDAEERSRTWLATKLGISHPSLLEKLKDVSKWKHTELQAMGKIKGIPIWV
jgi:transcriptional regulator with PAS, ATPase and Fis domain